MKGPSSYVDGFKNKELAASWQAKKVHAGKRRQTRTEQVRYPREDYHAFIFIYPRSSGLEPRCAHVYKSIECLPLQFQMVS